MRLGIDFGTTRTVVAVADRGNFPVIGFETPGGDVQPHFPSVVASDGQTLVYGHEALAKLDEPGWTGLRSFKRLLARGDAASKPTVQLGEHRIPLHDLLTGFLRALKQAFLEQSTNPVVAADDEPLEAFVAVPARASSAQRFLTLDAFRHAGFRVLGVLNEPSAAGVEYAHRYGKTLTAARQRVLVYDLGGGTFDISLVDMESARHTVLDNAGVNDLGGDDFDRVLLDLVLAQVPDAQPSTALFERCRVAKEGINPNSRRVSVDVDDEHTVSVSTADLYDAATPLIARSIDTIGEILGTGDGERFDTSELAGIYVVGGGSDLPIVARQLREVFPARRVKRSAYSSGATAVGLAIAASETGPTIAERFSRTFGVFRELDHGRDVSFDAILTRDTPLNPDGGEWTRRYRPAHNIGHFRFAECDRIEAGVPRGELTPFAELFFPFDPSLREIELDGVAIERAVGMPLVEERYRVDEAGIVSVRITDLESGWSREQTL